MISWYFDIDSLNCLFCLRISRSVYFLCANVWVDSLESTFNSYSIICSSYWSSLAIFIISKGFFTFTLFCIPNPILAYVLFKLKSLLLLTISKVLPGNFTYWIMWFFRWDLALLRVRTWNLWFWTTLSFERSSELFKLCRSSDIVVILLIYHFVLIGCWSHKILFGYFNYSFNEIVGS